MNRETAAHQKIYSWVMAFLTIWLFSHKEGFASSEFIYVSDPSIGTLYKIDAEGYEIMSKVMIGEAPFSLWGVAGNIFILDKSKPFLRVYNPITEKVTGAINVDVASSNGGFIWKNRWVFWGTVSPLPAIVKVDASATKVNDKLRLPGGSRPGGLDLAPNAKLYVTDSNRQKIYVVDPQTLRLIRELSTPERYQSVKIARNGKAYFIGSDKKWNPGDWIDVWDTKVNMFIERLRGFIPQGASFSEQAEGLASQQEMIISHELNRLIAIVYGSVSTVNPEPSPIVVAIDLGTKKVVWQVVGSNLEDQATALALSSRGELFVITKNDVKVIDIINGKVKKIVPLVNGWGVTTFIH